MASILRSGKIIRYFSIFKRGLVAFTKKEHDGTLLQSSQYLCSTLPNTFATAAAKPNQNLDRSLKRLDHDVRRTGRISRRDIEDILGEIRHQRSATSSQSLLVIRCCGNLVPDEIPETRTALVQEIWQTLKNLNVPMDISHYNALLRVYLENEHKFSPTDFLTELEAAGIEPNRVTYQRLIARYCQDGNIDGATRILEFMREKEFPVNEHVFNSLIIGHSQANDLESAVGILKMMTQAGLEPSSDTYTTLMCCYAKHGDIESILRTLDECNTKEIYFLDKDILDIIYELASNGNEDKVDILISKMRKNVGYNQDAINTIYRLINVNADNAAFKLLNTIPRAVKDDGEMVDTGYFFIRQLVKANRSFENILKMCKLLQENNINSKAILTATEASLSSRNLPLAISFLNEIKNAGYPIRQHYFWPLFCSCGPNNIPLIIENMKNFDLYPNTETLRDYVIPNLNENDLLKAVKILNNAGVSIANSTVAATYYALTLNKMNEAADISAKSKAYYSPGLFRKPLIQALSETKDYNNYIRIIRHIHDGIDRQTVFKNQDENNEEIETSPNKPEIIGYFIQDIVSYFKKDRLNVLENVLTLLVKEGLSISNITAERIQEQLGSQMTDDISQLLSKLSSNDLVPIERQTNFGIHNYSTVQLEQLLARAEAKNENTNGLKKILLTAYIKEKDLEKTENLLKKLENDNFVFTAGIYAQMIELYCHHKNLELAIETYNKIKTKEPDFVIDNLKTLKVAQLLINENKIDEAIQFLEQNKKDDNLNNENSFNYKTTCWRLLNSLAETGNPENVNKIFNVLSKNNFIEINNVMLGPLIKVHLINDNLKMAVDIFEDICNKYRMTPWKNELSCRLIQIEDADNLQRLTDLSTNIHGEINSLYDLVFSFVECGRIRQARKILETPGMKGRPQRINSACERYRNEGRLEPLEGLIEATSDLNHIDRSEIFYNLLLSYCKKNLPDKALSLWTKMQEDNIAPTDKFLIKLSDLLNENNLEVPFVIPSNKNVISNEIKEQDSYEEKKLETIDSINFKKALNNQNMKLAKEIKDKLKSENKLTPNYHSLYIEKLIILGELNKATENVFEMLENKQYPLARIFKFYLNKIAKNGDIETMDKINGYIDNKIKKLISYDNRYCNAMVSAGKANDVLKYFENKIDTAKNNNEIETFIQAFPRGGLLGLLEKHPELSKNVEQMALKYAEQGFIAPINVFWLYNFVQNNETVCQEIWDKYLKDQPTIMFNRILEAARDNNDEELCKKLLNYLKESKINEKAMGTAYSCLIDILTQTNKYDEALEVLRSAINDICLENFNHTALKRLQAGLVKIGKKFPYNLPKNSKKLDSSSSSSSDDEDEHNEKKISHIN